MAKIYIDNKPYEVDANKNLLEVILSLGYDLPYFCWHPAMGSVGACRQCAVKKYKDENDATGKLFMACMEPASDNTRLSIKDSEAVDFRANVIEWLMTNHPHDCPVCDEGGECHLQDMTLMTGHNYRRFRFKKRTYTNQNLGPFINHEMNRCIQCYRCVRYYRDYADGRDLNAFAAHNHVYFGRHEDGVLENEFSGNLVEVCPTGVFTDKTLKSHYTRKWDLTMAPSVCVHCSLGCNTIASERYGSVRRIMSRYNSEVNGYFLCDRGRFGYEFVNHKERIKSCRIKSKVDGLPKMVDTENAVAHFRQMKGNKIGIGSPKASLESNFMLQQLVGKENFYAGMAEEEFKLISKIKHILSENPVRTPSMKDVEKADVVLILGEDLTNTAPMMALAVRQAAHQRPMEIAANLKIPHWHDAAVRELVQEEKGPLFVATPYSTKLDEIAKEVFHENIEEIASFGFALANYIKNGNSGIKLKNATETGIKSIAEELAKAKNPLIISGTSCKNEKIIEAAANIAWAVHESNPSVQLSYIVPENNSLGLCMMTENNLKALTDKKQKTDSLIILENDIYERIEKEQADELLQNAENLVVLDFLDNATSSQANIVFASGTFAESDGTFINNEGRAQRFYQVYQPFGEIKESWRWLAVLQQENMDTRNTSGFMYYVQQLVQAHPQFTGIENLTPPPGFRIAGQKIPREPHRYSGRTAMHANANVSEPKPPEDPDSPLSFTMEGYHGQPPSSIIPFFWSPGWNSVQSINKYQIEVGGPLHGGDPGLRLFEPTGGKDVKYFNYVPAKTSNNEDEMNIIPIYHIFGSDRLSNCAPAVAKLVPQPYLAVGPEKLKSLDIKEVDSLKFQYNSADYELPVKIVEGLPDNSVGFPVGIPDIPVNFINKKVKIIR